MFSRTTNWPFSPNFDFATDNLLGTQINNNYNPNISPSDSFLLSDGSNLLLSDGTFFLLST